MKKTTRRKPKTVSDQLRAIVETCGVTRYRISQETGIDQGALSNFMAGRRGLSGKALDTLGAYLDLEVVRHGPKQ